MAEWERRVCWGRSSLCPQVTLGGCAGGSLSIPGQVLAAQMMLELLSGTALAFLITRNRRGQGVLWYRSSTKGEDNDKIRLPLVETATLDTAAKRTEGSFFNVFIVC